MRRFPRWLKILGIVIPLLLLILAAALFGLGWYVRSQILDSGGTLPPSMAAYDVLHYHLEVSVDPVEKVIEGSNMVAVRTLAALDHFEIHLDDHLQVRSVRENGEELSFTHHKGVVRAELTEPWRQGERRELTIAYGGAPKVALRPPWIDGFVWSETPTGRPWIGVTSQGDGGDVWWPCKDHPSDEPDEGMSISLTVPSNLVGLTNGRNVGERDNNDGTTTSEWRVGYPINNYLVTVNIAPYVPVSQPYFGVDGTLDEELVFWSTPESVGFAEGMWRQMPRILEVLGRRFGEYPFFGDKFAVAHAPYYGMEHQTIVAYGALFTDNDYAFDELLLHEVAHEWWGNKITVADWADFWIHEGFATYAEALYVYDTMGEEPYLEYLKRQRDRVRNREPIIGGSDLTSAEAYSGDIYFKGSWVLHTLRWVVGDEAFFEILWRFANDDRYAYGLVSTDDFTALVAEVSGLELDWFWSRYLYRADEPRWRMVRRPGDGGDRLVVTWDDPAFELTLPVMVDGIESRLEMAGGRGELMIDPGTSVKIDPKGRVLASPRD
jgi:aminopeptidase N